MVREQNAERRLGRLGEPDELLEEFIAETPTGRALDLGVGHGDNALWLAERGFSVIGVDVSEAAVETVQQLAREYDLSVDVRVGDVREFEIEPASYSLVLASAVLHFLLPDEVRTLARRIKAGLHPGGVVIAHVFTVDDPSYQVRQKMDLPLVAERTFFVPDLDGPLHYFDFGELRSLFDDLEILYYAEERHLAAPHDYVPYHAGAFLVARKTDDIDRKRP